MNTVSLSRDEARAFLLAQLGLERPLARAKSERGRGPHVRALLRRLRCIQLDPLDPMGTNADLVAMARLPGLRRGEVYRHVYRDGAAFEHFAKERCLLPASAFPHYRARMVQTPWWRLTERTKRVPQPLVDEVEAEVRERGPISAKALSDRGRVHRGALVGRISGRVEGTTLVIDGLWREESPLDDAALDAALEAHDGACGCDTVKRPKRARRA